jgi:hypothetical protein
MKGDRDAGGYSLTTAQGSWEEPKWAEISFSFRDLVEKAFKGQVVDRPDHSVIQKLFGEK